MGAGDGLEVGVQLVPVMLCEVVAFVKAWGGAVDVGIGWVTDFDGADAGEVNEVAGIANEAVDGELVVGAGVDDFSVDPWVESVDEECKGEAYMGVDKLFFLIGVIGVGEEEIKVAPMFAENVEIARNFIKPAGTHSVQDMVDGGVEDEIVWRKQVSVEVEME